MNLSELRELDNKQLVEKLNELKKDLMKLRVSRGTGQTVKTHLFKQTKRVIAQVKTLMTQREAGN